MSVTTINLEMDTEQMRKIFGMQDAYIKSWSRISGNDRRS